MPESAKSMSQPTINLQLAVFCCHFSIFERRTIKEELNYFVQRKIAGTVSCQIGNWETKILIFSHQKVVHPLELSHLKEVGFNGMHKIFEYNILLLSVELRVFDSFVRVRLGD